VDTPQSFAGDFEWEIKVAGAPQGDKKIMSIVDNSDNIFNFGTFSSGGQNTFRIFANRGLDISGSIVILNNKLNTLKIKYVAATGSISVFVNGVLDTEAAGKGFSLPDMTDLRKFSVGAEARNNGGGFTGYLADFKVTNGSTLVIDAPLDKQYTAENPTVINKADASNNLTAVNLDNAGQLFTLNAAETIWTGEDGTTLEIG
jgi:hypothetical protein